MFGSLYLPINLDSGPTSGVVTEILGGDIMVKDVDRGTYTDKYLRGMGGG